MVTNTTTEDRLRAQLRHRGVGGVEEGGAEMTNEEKAEALAEIERLQKENEQQRLIITAMGGPLWCYACGTQKLDAVSREEYGGEMLCDECYAAWQKEDAGG